MSGKRMMGVWEFDPELLTLEHDGYQVDLEEMTDSAGILDWIMQVHGKTWATPRALCDLIEAVRKLLDPQANVCSFGQDRKVDPASLIRGREARW